MKMTWALVCFLLCFHQAKCDEQKKEIPTEEQKKIEEGQKEDTPQEKVLIEKSLTKNERKSHQLIRKHLAAHDKAVAQKCIAKYPQYSSAVSSPVYRVKSVGATGKTLSFDDETLWETSPSYSSTLRYWGPGTYVVIVPNTHWFSSYTYRLENISDHSSVSANLSEGPFTKYALFISSIDYLNNLIILADNSVWYIPPSVDAHHQVQNWQPGQAVLIGENRGWWGYQCGHILININENIYLPALFYRQS